MHCNRRDFVVWMSDICSKCPLIEFHNIQTKEIICRQFSPSPCLFAEPEAVSKHSVSLWIGHSGYRQYIIDVPISEIEPRCQLFFSRWEQVLYKFRFVWTQKYVTLYLICHQCNIILFEKVPSQISATKNDVGYRVVLQGHLLLIAYFTFSLINAPTIENIYFARAHFPYQLFV